MSSLLSLYKAKEKNGTETTVKKTFLVPLAELYVEPGYNVREIDQEHVAEFRDAFIAGEFVPPLAVQVTEQGIKIIDGHHRYYGAKMASEAGHEIPRLECKDFSGSEADRIAFMVTSSQGKALSPLERAAAYQRLLNQGWTPAEIAKKVKRSPADVDQHLQLLECGDAALYKQLQLYFKRGANTLSSIVNKYAPAGDNNNVGAYISALSSATGKGANEALDPNDTGTIARLMKGIVDHENGKGYISSSDIMGGIRLGAGVTSMNGSPSPSGSGPQIHIGEVNMTTSATNANALGQDIMRNVQRNRLVTPSLSGQG